MSLENVNLKQDEEEEEEEEEKKTWVVLPQPTGLFSSLLWRRARQNGVVVVSNRTIFFLARDSFKIKIP